MPQHIRFSENKAPLEIRMPAKERVIEFNNWQKTQRSPFVVYADLEAINVPTTIGNNSTLKTREVERQFPASYGAILLDYRS